MLTQHAVLPCFTHIHVVQEQGADATCCVAVQVAYVEWLCSQLRRPSHPTHSVPAVVGDLAVALQDPPMRLLYTRAGLLSPRHRRTIWTQDGHKA